jgi:nucleosome binding factor SPN SPT16 subunit
MWRSMVNHLLRMQETLSTINSIKKIHTERVTERKTNRARDETEFSLRQIKRYLM